MEMDEIVGSGDPVATRLAAEGIRPVAIPSALFLWRVAGFGRVSVVSENVETARDRLRTLLANAKDVNDELKAKVALEIIEIPGVSLPFPNADGVYVNFFEDK